MAGLDLHDLGPFPMAVLSANRAAVLHGELYGVDSEQLSELDRLEGCPRLYERRCWPLREGGHAWVYVGQGRQVRHSPLISSGIWQGGRCRPEPKR